MAARGTEAKEKVTEIILKTFDGAFMEGKNIRIPYKEGSDEVQIKVTLTAAKTNVPNPETEAQSIDNGVTEDNMSDYMNAPITTDSIKPTEEEKKEVKDLLGLLGL